MQIIPAFYQKLSRIRKKEHCAKHCKNIIQIKPTLACIGHVKQSINNDIWIMDIGFTVHTSKNRDLMEELKPVKADIVVGNSTIVTAEFIGKVKLNTLNYFLEFKNVLLNEKAPCNLVSLHMMVVNDWVGKSVDIKNFVLVKTVSNW